MAACINIISVLEDFLSSDDSVRRVSQAWVENAEFEIVLLELLNGLEIALSDDIRGLAAVLLKVRIDAARRAGERESVAKFVRDKIAPRVLNQMGIEPDRLVRYRLCGTVATLADFCYPEGEDWADLWKLIGQYLSRRNPEYPNAADDVACRITALVLLSRLAETNSTLHLLETYVLRFQQFLSQSLDNSALFEEKHAAFELIAAIDEGISCNNLELVVAVKALRAKGKATTQFTALKKMLRTFVSSMLISLEQAMTNFFQSKQDDSELRSLLKVVVDITDADPMFWVDATERVLSLMARVALDVNLDFHLRQCALGVITKAASTALRRAETIKKNDASAQSVAESVSQIVQQLLIQTTSFVETDEEWQSRREDSSIDSFDVEDILEALCMFIGQYLDDAASPVADKSVLSMALSLLSSSSPVAAVVGVRFLSQLVTESPDIIEPSSDSVLLQITSRYSLSDGNNVSSFMRFRWWILKLLCDMFEAYGPTLQLSRLSESLSCLSNAICSDPVIRCKCRAMTALYTFLAPLESCQSIPLLDSFTESIAKDIIVPAIQTDHDEIQELGFALATVLAGIAGESFSRYYADFMGASVAVLKNSIEIRRMGRNDTKKEFNLCEAAIGLSAQLVSSVGPIRCRQDLHFLCESFIDVVAYSIKRSNSNDPVPLSLSTVFKGIRIVATALSGEFASYIPRYAESVFYLIRQCDSAQVTSEANGTVCSDTGLDASTAYGVLGKVAAGRVECQEEGGVTRLSVKTKNGENKIIEIKEQIIDEKGAALESLVEILPLIGKYWIPYISETLELLKIEVNSSYRVVRESALEACGVLLSCLLPGKSETMTPWSESQCALATGSISSEDFYHLGFDLTKHLLSVMNKYRSPRAAEVIPVIEVLIDSIHEAKYFHPIKLESESSEFIRCVFEQFGKRLVVTMEEDILSQNEPKIEDSEIQEENEADWLDEGSSDGDSEDDDIEGTIYSGIMRTFGQMIKIFDRNECTQLFMTHLNTPYSGLLTLPEANMSGRAAALCIFGILLESGDPSIRTQIAKDITPVVLLYIRCNDISVMDKTRSDDIYSDDVYRLQAASYCLGIIAATVPQVFIHNFVASVNSLHQILSHPQSDAEERLPAAECAVGALIRIYTTPELRDYVATIDPSDDVCIKLISRWLPFRSDEDESRSITDLILDVILTNRVPKFIENPEIRKQLSRFLSDLIFAHVENPALINKDTWTSRKIFQAQQILAQ